MNEQREIIYNKRNEIIDNDDIHSSILEMFHNAIQSLCDAHLAPENKLTDHDKSEIIEYLNTNLIKTIFFL